MRVILWLITLGLFCGCSTAGIQVSDAKSAWINLQSSTGLSKNRLVWCTVESNQPICIVPEIKYK